MGDLKYGICFPHVPFDCTTVPLHVYAAHFIEEDGTGLERAHFTVDVRVGGPKMTSLNSSPLGWEQAGFTVSPRSVRIMRLDRNSGRSVVTSAIRF